MVVKERRSANNTVTSHSCPARYEGLTKPSLALASAGSRGTTAVSPVGLSWQASRTLAGAPMRLSTFSSAGLGIGRDANPLIMRILQVEHRPRPPHTEA